MATDTSWGRIASVSAEWSEIQPIMPEFLRAPLVAILLPTAVILWVIVLGAILLESFARVRISRRFLAIGAVLAVGCSLLLGIVATSPSEITS